ncbi:MAG: hypothetical protein IJX81_07390 [Clostridia bacterium]|nr:hypothetical protein [Clostridia bacterium]
MKKYLRYELKKNRNALIVLTVLCALIAGVVMVNINLFSRWPAYTESGVRVEGEYRIVNGDGGLSFFCMTLALLCVFVAVYQYAFKMKKRSVDAFYALPIRKEKLYFGKTLIGLLMVFIPYTVAYLLGITIVLCRENYFHLGWYLPYYFASVGLGVCLYFFYAFIFTRANTLVDGLVFMLGWSFLFELATYFICGALSESFGLSALAEILHERGYMDFEYMAIGGLISVETAFARLLASGTLASFRPQALLFSLLCGGAAASLFFLLLKKEKAENAEQISSSLWGYRTLIPAYLTLCVALTGNDPLLNIVLLAAGFVGYVVYRRSVRLKVADWISLAASFLAGLLLMGLI